MDDDDVDPELVALFRQRFGIGSSAEDLTDTKVLSSASFVCDNSIDVALDMQGTRAAAAHIWAAMQARKYSTADWKKHELHPTEMDESTVNFIFMMDLLNFSFWSETEKQDARFCIEYRGRRWTGYWSLVAALRRALDEGVPITTPSFWRDEVDCTDDALRRVFGSATAEPMPMFAERASCLRETSAILQEKYNDSVVELVKRADGSAAVLVNMLARDFPCFRDETTFERRKVRFLKKAQIFVADLWAAFEEEGYGSFSDIDKITMFADYRIPQALVDMGCLNYSPPLDSRIRQKLELEPSSSLEIQIRGCAIWCVEGIRREIIRTHPDAKVNAILIDFFLFDALKERERDGQEATIPHHRTRSIWY